MTPTPRSFLFVPGDRPERFPKALASGAHVLVLDLEDAVGPSQKDQARDHVSNWLAQGHPTTVRINAMDTPWYEADMAMIGEHANASVMLPKADTYAATHTLGALPRCRLIALLETIGAYMNLSALAHVKGLERIAFGSIDFSTESGISDEGEALTSVRTQIVLASRHAGLPAPIDGVSVEFHDEDLIRRMADCSVLLGFGGKLCIHPRQVAAVNNAWQPDAREVDWAQRIMTAFRESAGNAIAIDGKMIDKPVFERARLILQSAGVAH